MRLQRHFVSDREHACVQPLPTAPPRDCRGRCCPIDPPRGIRDGCVRRGSYTDRKDFELVDHLPLRKRREKQTSPILQLTRCTIKSGILMSHVLTHHARPPIGYVCMLACTIRLFTAQSRRSSSSSDDVRPHPSMEGKRPLAIGALSEQALRIPQVRSNRTSSILILNQNSGRCSGAVCAETIHTSLQASTFYNMYLGKLGIRYSV